MQDRDVLLVNSSCGQVKMQGLELPCGQMTHSQTFSAHHYEHHSHHAYLRPPSLASHFSLSALICVYFYQCSTKLFRPHPPSGGCVACCCCMATCIAECPSSICTVYNCHGILLRLRLLQSRGGSSVGFVSSIVCFVLEFSLSFRLGKVFLKASSFVSVDESHSVRVPLRCASVIFHAALFESVCGSRI